jgi:serine/threonine-protein kinase RsbW
MGDGKTDQKKRNKRKALSSKGHPKKRSGPKAVFSLVLQSRLSELGRIEPFLNKVNRVLHCDEIQFHKLMVATTEAVSNAIIHGNKRDPKKKVTVTCECNTRPPSVAIHVKDMGEGFDLANVPSPLQRNRLLAQSGRGIFLMRVLMDTVRHRVDSDGSEVVMTLRICR